MEKVRQNMIYHTDRWTLSSKVNQREWYVGEFSVPSVIELNSQISTIRAEIIQDLDLLSLEKRQELSISLPFLSTFSSRIFILSMHL